MTEEKKPNGKAKADPAATEEFFAKQEAIQQEQLEAMSKFAMAKAEAEAEAERRALRDDFAKAALTGLLAHHGNLNMRSLADAAFQYADFMLEIRDDSTR